MKKLNLFMILFAVSLAIPSISQVADVSVLGSPISSKEAFSWIGNYKNNFGGAHAVYFGKNSLLQLINQPGVEGVYILRGLDESKKEVLLFKAANKNGFLIEYATLSNGSTDLKNVTQEVGSLIDDAAASQLTERFRLTYQGRTPIYLYGKKGFENLLQQEGAQGIQFINGADEKGEEHLIMMGVDKNGSQLLGTIWNHGSGIFGIIDYLFGRK